MVKLNDILHNFAFVKGVNKFYAYRYRELNDDREMEYRGWRIYQVKKEFMRQGLITEDQGGLPLKYI